MYLKKIVVLYYEHQNALVLGFIFNFTHSFHINLIIMLYFLHLLKHFYQLRCIKLIKSDSKDIYNVAKNLETKKLILTCFQNAS